MAETREIVKVYGKLNGQLLELNPANEERTLWTATVPRVEGDKYELELFAEDSDGVIYTNDVVTFTVDVVGLQAAITAKILEFNQKLTIATVNKRKRG